MVADMEITQALVDRVRNALDLTGWTWEQVKGRGGPSSTTMTALKAGRVGQSITPATLRKLDTAFGWGVGTARSLVDPTFFPDVSDSTRETQANPAQPSAVGDTFPVIEERKGEVSGRNVVKVRFAALGVEVETTYTDGEDRAAVLAEIMAAVGLTGELSGQGDNDRS